jgi:signal transduction histidine kinase/CheY-like chemotaxis protein
MKKARIFNPQNRFRNFMLIAMFVSVLLMIDDYITGVGDAFSYSVFSTGIVSLACLIMLYKKGHETAARVLSILLFNSIFFAFTFYFGLRSLSMIFYFPFLVSFIYMLKERGTRIEGTVLFGGSLLYIVACFSLCSLDGYGNKDASHIEAMFVKNFIAAFVLAGYYLYEIFAYHVVQNKTLQDQKEIAEEASRSKARFLSIISHELRTPLNGIIGTLNLMTTTDDEAQKIRYQRILESSSKQLLHLVNNVLDYSKASAGKIQLSPVAFRIDETLRDLYNIFQSRFVEKEIDFRFSMDPALSTTVLADDVRFTQVITNLLSNALKYTDAGFVQLSAGVHSLTASDVQIQISVTDTGRGISEDQQDQIFDTFNNISNKSRNVESTGLGLSIAKMIIDLMDGTLSIASAPGKGSTFALTCKFPLAVEEVQTVFFEHEHEHGFSLDQRKILVAEDNEINMLVIREFLKKWNIQISEAVNGQEAITLLQERDDIDLVLLDLQMPEIDGYQVLEWLKKNKSDLPAIAFTASLLDGQDKTQLLELGFHDVVAKPFSPTELEAKLKQALSKSYTQSGFAA